MDMNKFTSEEVEKIRLLKKTISGYYKHNNLFMEYNDIIVVAGGCFASLFHGEKPKDYDFFILNSDERKFEKVKAAFNNTLRNLEYKDKSYSRNPNIIATYNDPITNIQYILTKYKSRKELLDHFDYQHCVVSYESLDDKLYISPATYKCIKDKLLIPNNNNIPHDGRTEKFKNRGWHHPYYHNKIDWVTTGFPVVNLNVYE